MGGAESPIATCLYCVVQMPSSRRAGGFKREPSRVYRGIRDTENGIFGKIVMRLRSENYLISLLTFIVAVPLRPHQQSSFALFGVQNVPRNQPPKHLPTEERHTNTAR